MLFFSLADRMLVVFLQSRLLLMVQGCVGISCLRYFLLVLCPYLISKLRSGVFYLLAAT